MRTLAKLLAVVGVLAFSAHALADRPVNNFWGEVAVFGVDIVEAVDNYRAVARKGSVMMLSWNGVNFCFASGGTKQRFLGDPHRYAKAVAYSGYCAYGVAKGYPFPVDPLTCKVVKINGQSRLQCNINAKIAQRLDREQSILRPEAEKRWKDGTLKRPR